MIAGFGETLALELAPGELTDRRAHLGCRVRVRSLRQRRMDGTGLTVRTWSRTPRPPVAEANTLQ